MPSLLRTPKTLSAWLELDYFRRRRLFLRLKRTLSLTTAIATILCLGFLLQAAGKRTFQAGPLSTPHAMFDHQCDLCHQDHGGTLARMWNGDRVGSVPDRACTQCHAGSHHHEQAAMGRCVSCHREHRGHAALMVRTDDRGCVACHQNLKREDGKTPEVFAQISQFAEKGHPEFRFHFGGDQPDPGTIRFNHAAHLGDEGVMTFDGKQWHRHQKTLAEKKIDLWKEPRPWQRKKLVCNDCHQTDREGRFMTAISYEKHCKECHPLSTQIVGHWKDSDLHRRAGSFAAQAVAHPRKGEKADRVRSDLRDRLVRFITTPGNHRFLDAEQEVPMPRLPLPAATAPREEKEYAWVNRYLGETESLLFDSAGGCAYCHSMDRPRRPDRPNELPVIQPPGIKDHWWTRAVFTHGSHRMLDCTGCHGQAKTSEKTSDVLLPDRALCLKCHDAKAPARRSARSDCVECHVYHDPKLQREARDWGGEMTLERLGR